MAINVIPPLKTRGKYVLKPPFDAAMTPDTLYTLEAIRCFDDIDALGENIFELFYKPFLLTEQDVQNDRTNDPTLITLMSPTSQPLYVPVSYVHSYPDLAYRPYNQYVMCLSVGPLPDDTLFEPTQTALANTCSDFLGVTPEVHIAYMPLSDVITPEENDTREAARQGAIKNRTTDYARLYEANAKIAMLEQRCAILEKIVIDNGLLP